MNNETCKRKLKSSQTAIPIGTKYFVYKIHSAGLVVWGLRQTNIKTPENTNMKLASAFKRDAILEMNTHFIWNALSNHEFEMFVKFNGIIKKEEEDVNLLHGN
ncbi:hypothetical protein [Geobacillus thermodenitrificans]|uniref:hypothetical protein n=1 Tax=Geobacillus thermodenitrificans TaxID=33940 RepID=UPI0026A58891|nr:hypothetical protein [Geobacillus thermodenitrificans]